MDVDYIIVGFGLAGMAFVSELEKNNKSFVVFEDASQTSSNVAGGVYNPVILKRFTPVWQGDIQIQLALPFYKHLEDRFSNRYIYPFDTYRIFNSIEEQNNWFSASDKPLLSKYMDTNIVHTSYNGITSTNGFGKLSNTGRIDTKQLLDDYKSHLLSQNKFLIESFDHSKINIEDPSLVSYESISAKSVVFCEGFGLVKNPFFNYLPMKEAKGELLTIHAPDLDIDFLIKSSVFVLPLGNHHYKVGATFDWKDKTLDITPAAKEELVEKLNKFITVPFTVVNQSAGIRPTVKDRRPLVGIHPKHPRLAILNGLGTRGVMIAPKVASELFKHLSLGEPLDTETDIQRFSI